MLWIGFPDSHSTPSTVTATFEGVRVFATRTVGRTGCE